MNASPPRSRGNLGDRDLPDLVQDLSRLRWNGVLVLGRMGVEVRLSFQDGGMVFASSSDPDSRLGPRLLRRGALTLHQLADASRAIAPGKRLGTILVEQGILVPKDLVRAVVDQTQEIQRVHHPEHQHPEHDPGGNPADRVVGPDRARGRRPFA